VLYRSIELLNQALGLVLLLSAPPIVAAAIAGLIVGIVQSATQLHDQTLQYAAKFLVIVLVIFAMGSVIGSALYAFGNRAFDDFPLMLRQ